MARSARFEDFNLYDLVDDFIESNCGDSFHLVSNVFSFVTYHFVVVTTLCLM